VALNKTHLTAYPDRPIPAVGALVVHQGRVLLVRRGSPPALGEWAIPGGRIHLGETLQQAAEREIFEETGVRIRAGAPLFTFDAIHRDDAGRIQYHYVIIDLAADYLSGTPTPGDDAADARWVSPDQFDTLPMNAASKQFLKRFGTEK